MSRVILLVDSFPYKNGENFLETEIKYSNMQIDIFPYQKINPDDEKRFVTDNIKVHIRRNDENSNIVKKFCSYLGVCLKKEVLSEVFYLLKTKKISLSSIKTLLYFYVDAMKYYKWILEEISTYSDSIVIYSYWMFIQAFTAAKIKNSVKNSVFITRCHGFDLYEDRHTSHYLPFRNYIFNNANLICPVSKQGASYLLKKYTLHKNKVQTSYLGTECEFQLTQDDLLSRKGEILRIVTCSSVNTVKRVDLIVHALKNIKDIEIQWTHIGGGNLLDSLKELAEYQLPSNIKTDFRGQLSSSQVNYVYAHERFDTFVNVSESEGLPVSMMEACAYYIPIIATDVGGVSEIVIEQKNGFLISKDFHEDELIGRIKDIFYMDKEDYRNMCLSSRKVWESQFNGKSNYSNFYKMILKL